MASIYLGPEGPSSGRRFCVQLWYCVFYRQHYKHSCS